MQAEFENRSGHEQLATGHYNKEAVKTYDSEDSNYEASDSDDIEGKLSVESDNVKTRDLWRLYYNTY